MAAEEHAAQQGPTAGEYIGHHLQHLRTGEQSGVIDMSVFNLDSIFWSVLLGCLDFLSCGVWPEASRPVCPGACRPR